MYLSTDGDIINKLLEGPMPNVIKQKDREYLDKRIPMFPWYVEQFINYKLPDLSPSSLLEYTRDYETFFKWLMAEGLTKATSFREIELEELAILRSEDVTNYQLFLTTRKDNPNQKVSRNRKIVALRTLFHYLSQLAEDEQFNPLLRRNVMAKVEIKRSQKPKDTAARLEGKLLQESEIVEFIDYVMNVYQEDITRNKQAMYSWEKNKIRDAAIVSLILGSGLRVSQVINLDLDDVNLRKKMVHVYKKGNNDESFKSPVYFREEAVDFLKAYNEIRDKNYKVHKKEKAFFVALKNGSNEGARMTKRAIQEMVVKYAKRFGKPYLSVHKLRHSFATDYYEENDLYKTQEQLGHSSPETTQIYAHLTDKTLSKAIDNRRSRRDD
jgi:site-specific recombinase XerD